MSPKSRAWGTRFDSLPSSSPPPASPDSPDSVHHQPESAQLSVKKMSHDASVFVGSLPPNVEQNELARLLSNHLEEFTRIVTVKVIRDLKGGVCAFVQCENPDAAAKLIDTLHSTAPKPFLGRELRYEIAKAHRSLLISYRVPTETKTIVEDGITAEKIVELTFPCAMRISKLIKNSKFTSIYYDNEAKERQANQNILPRRDVAFFSEPLLCDVDTLKQICAFFGSLERFEPYKAEGQDDKALFPSPHDALRSPNMDKGCYEVKWHYRDNCLSALNTLRRVPHLTVTWAHPAPALEFHQGRDYRPYPLYSQVRSFARPSTSGANSDGSHSNTAELSRWKLDSRLSSTPRNVFQGLTSQDKDAAWHETDFPPLVERNSDFKSGLGGVWVGKKPSEKSEGNFVDGSSNPFVATYGSLFDVLDNAVPFRNDVTHSDMSISTDTADGGQELERRRTPGLSRSPVTPRTPGSVFPPTPTSFHGAGPVFLSKDMDNEFPYRENEGIRVNEFDPTSLFVGGLEVNGPGAWDEQKLYSFFQRFEGLESVHVIRPNTGKAAFAFVKFNNTNGPSRAISELHNRIVEGRTMRVQLRSCNPPRSFHGHRRRYSNINHGYQPRRDSQPDSKIDKCVEASFPLEALPAGDVPTEATPTPACDPPQVDQASANAEPKSPAHPITDAEPASQGPEPYREWYDMGEHRLSAPTTTSSIGGPFVAQDGGLAMPYHMPGFYAPGPWMQPFPMGYCPPLYPFPGPNAPPPRYISSAGSDTGSNTSLPPIPWNGVNYGGNTLLCLDVTLSNFIYRLQYIPYHGYPPRPSEQPSSQIQEQPPVVPTGFLQHEVGTLIPVYPRAIIDQYMTNNPNQTNSPPVGVPVTVPVTVPSPVGGPVQSWSQCGPPSFGSNHFTPSCGPVMGQPTGWITPGQGMNMQGPGATHASNFPVIGIPPPFRDGLQGGMQNGNKRQGGRQFQGKGRGNYRGRGSNTFIAGFPHGEGLGNRDGQFNGFVGDWTHWPEGRQEVGKPFIS